MGEIRVVLIFNEDNERQKEIGRYLKSQKRCKTALITELVYAWLHKENASVSSYNNANVSVEDMKIPSALFVFWTIFRQDRNTARPQCCKIKLPDSSVPTVIYHVYHHL